MIQSQYDVIVVGGGGSGLAAAVSAAEHGASVLLLEKQPELGGSTGIAVGSITANRTSIQHRAGIQDSLEDHAADAGLFAPPAIEARNNEALRRWFLGQGAASLHWLMGMGVNFYGPNPEPPNRAPRMHNVVPGAKALIAALHARLIRLGGEMLTSAPVVELIRPGERVEGVVALIKGERRKLSAARGVVLAAGDYANSAAIISRFIGGQYAEIEGINPHSGGDGHILAEKAGAQLINMDVTYGPEIRFIAPKKKTFQQLLPAQGPLSRLMGAMVPYVPQFLMSLLIKRLLVTWQHPENSLFEDGAILVNTRGERFCDERCWPEREIAIAQQPGKIAFILLDARLSKRYSAWPHFISTAPKIGYAYVANYLKLRPDIACQAPNLQSIARERNLPAEALTKSVAAFNRGEREERPALTEGPWVLFGPAKAYFTTTEGGAAINQRLQVLDVDNAPIPGLYAVGQNGLGGQILWSHGLHISWAITSGRIAGEILAEKNGEGK